MDNYTENSQIKNRGKFKKSAKFHMAYSIDNEQPVRCTLLNEQPFFYEDEEFIMDDDMILSDENFNQLNEEDFNTLQSEIKNLKSKMENYDKFSKSFTRTDNEAFDLFSKETNKISQRNTDNLSRLEEIKNVLLQSRMATALLNNAEKYGVTLCCTNQTEDAQYDRKSSKILIRNDLDLVDQVLLTVQELRRHWQHRQGASVHPLTFHPDQAVLINRAQMADLSASVVRCAWEFKLLGKNEFWHRIENSSMADLGRAFAREALNDFRTLNNGKAAAAVFETWFLSERCRMQDKKLIQAMLADYRGYVFDHSATSKLISIDLICALGEQPLGKNYLAPYAQMIMNDPVFTDVRDRSNANFLWFIKFERSFQETEQELQSSNVINKLGVDQADNNDITEDTADEHTFQIMDVYASPELEQAFKSEFKGDKSKKFRNNVINVRFGNEEVTRDHSSSKER